MMSHFDHQNKKKSVEVYKFNRYEPQPLLSTPGQAVTTSNSKFSISCLNIGLFLTNTCMLPSCHSSASPPSLVVLIYLVISLA